jgi:Uma2 family endonuclease
LAARRARGYLHRVGATTVPPVELRRFTAQAEHRRFTADEVLRMVESGVLGEDEPLELLDGELVVVSPQGPPHADAATTLHELLVKAYEEKGVQVRDDKPLLVSPVSLPEPDLAVVLGTRGSFTKRHPRGDEAWLVVELARTSLPLDRAKAAVYAAGGVPVYWIVDVEARRIEVHADPHADGHYGVVHVLSEDDPAPLPGTDAVVRARDFL